MAETVVGATSGVVPAPKGYFKGRGFLRSFRSSNSAQAMKSVCDKYGALFILDEASSPNNFVMFGFVDN